MNGAVIEKFQLSQMKANVADVRPGETVRVHYRIRESGKEREQIFEGLVIGTKAVKSYQGSFTIRKVVDGVGVERTFPFHSPWLTKVERVKSGKVRRAKLNFVRDYALSRRFKLTDKGVGGAIWEDKKIPLAVETSEPTQPEAQAEELLQEVDSEPIKSTDETGSIDQSTAVK